MPYVPPEYPGDIPDADEIFPYEDDVDDAEVACLDATIKEVRAIMAELGTDPAGVHADVKTRLDSYRQDMLNLVVVLNTTNPTYQVDVDADALQVEQYALTAINLTIDITASGANGLDTGAEAGNTWYSVWAIYNPATDTAAGLLSTSETSPTLPAGYTKKRKVGHVRNGASSNFNDNGSVAESFGDVYHDRGDPASSDFTEPDLTTDGNWNDLDLSVIVPPGARAVSIRLYLYENTVGAYFYMRRDGNTQGYAVPGSRVQVANVDFVSTSTVACSAGRIIEYRCSNITWSQIVIQVCGWWR